MRFVTRRLGAGVLKQSGSSGQALVEFALLVPFLLIILMGVFEVGRAWQRYQIITDVAREGGRLAAIAARNSLVTEDSVRTVITGELDGAGLDATLATVEFENFTSGFGIGQEVSVFIDYPHNFVLIGPLMDAFRGTDPGPAVGNISLKTRVWFRKE